MGNFSIFYGFLGDFVSKIFSLWFSKLIWTISHPISVQCFSSYDQKIGRQPVVVNCHLLMSSCCSKSIIFSRTPHPTKISSLNTNGKRIFEEEWWWQIVSFHMCNFIWQIFCDSFVNYLDENNFSEVFGLLINPKGGIIYLLSSVLLFPSV